MNGIIKEGVSLRRIQVWQIVITVIMSVIVLFSTFWLTNTFSRLTHAHEQHTELAKAAYELMDASDYLTERVQRFTLDGDMQFLNDYFDEAFRSQRREDAIAKMSTGEESSEALKQLQEALNNSVILMDTEYYAMKLVIEAKGYTDYPELLESIRLSDEDAALAPEDKMRRATDMVLNNDYYARKDRIRTDMRESLAAIDEMALNTEAEEHTTLSRELTIVRIVIVIQTLFILFMVIMTSLLGINPVLRAVDMIRSDSPIPEKGANEFRYLAKAYNKMYSSYRHSLDHLKYKASHDELTGAYNRSGYDLLLSSIDLDSTYVMLFDVDNFKTINDNYGHEAGDKALIKLVHVLESVFRDDDCICRIGGDEFIVFMVHTNNAQKKLVSAKMEQISKELEDTSDGTVPFSVSVGIIHGKQAGGADNLFEKIDAAMYTSKDRGKNSYTFFSDLK